MRLYFWRLSLIILCVFNIPLLFLHGGVAAGSERITFVDWPWDSAAVHNRVAGFILSEGYGYDVDYVTADAAPGMIRLISGSLDVSMETWTDNFAAVWPDLLESGTILDLGPNFPDAQQGWYVPTYLIEGAPERGIEPLAPNLRGIDDIVAHVELFRSPEDPSKGRFHNCPTGWLCHDINIAKMKAYGLTQTLEMITPGSHEEFDRSIVHAYENGEPWLGYHWEPTWVLGEFEMTRLEEPVYTDECWETHMGCAYPVSEIRVVATASLAERAPDAIEFLSNYQTELRHTNEVLAFMKRTGATPEEAAVWLLREYESLWNHWVEPAVAARVKSALESRESSRPSSE